MAVRLSLPFTCFSVLLNAILISTVFRVRQLGIRIPCYRSPRASHSCDSFYLTTLMSFLPESQYGVAIELCQRLLVVYG